MINSFFTRQKITFFFSLFTLSITLFFCTSQIIYASEEKKSLLITAKDLRRGHHFLDLDAAQFYIPKQQIQKKTSLTLSIKENSENSADPIFSSSSLESSGDLFRYHITFPAPKKVVARMRYDFSQKEEKRKYILYQAPKSDRWEKLDTTMHKKKGYLSARLPQRKGKLLVATHRSKKEIPKKRISFVSYAGTEYSDKAVVMDLRSKKFLYKQKANDTQHIASITKLVTVALFLEQQKDLDEMVSYNTSYDRIGATVSVKAGDVLTLRDVLYATLLPSANNMAVFLSDTTPYSEKEFVEKMNALVTTDLGLKNTQFIEPTGLHTHNRSSATDVALFASHIFQSYPKIFSRAASLKEYSFTIKNGEKKQTVVSTNLFDGKGKYRVKGFKTGYYPVTAERTLVLWIESKEKKGEIIIVLLGNPKYSTIFEEAYEIADWTFQNWKFHNY